MTMTRYGFQRDAARGEKGRKKRAAVSGGF
jgi:hypothetical protein